MTPEEERVVRAAEAWLKNRVRHPVAAEGELEDAVRARSISRLAADSSSANGWSLWWAFGARVARWQHQREGWWGVVVGMG